MIPRPLAAALGVALLLSLPGCGDDDAPGTADVGAAGPPSAAATEPEASPSASRPAIVPGADPEVDAAAAAWTTVFDSSVPVADKLEFLADPDAVEATLGDYAETGEQVGGITLDPTAVEVDRDAATVIYDVSFAGNPAYRDQTGQLQRSGEGWVVGTEQFCEFMATARTPCPEDE